MTKIDNLSCFWWLFFCFVFCVTLFMKIQKPQEKNLQNSKKILKTQGRNSKLKEETQNSSTKLKVLANLVKINAENKANISKHEGNLD